MSRRRARLTIIAALTAVLLAAGVPAFAQEDGGGGFLGIGGNRTTTTTTTAPPSTTTTTAPPSTTTTTAPGSPSSVPVPGSSSSTTTTTAPPSNGGSTSTTAPGEVPEPSDGTEAPEGSGTGEDAEGEAPSSGPRTIPSEAQAIIDAYPRTGSSSSAALLAGVEELIDLGLTRDEAIRIGFGRFPVGGLANYSHDWLFPRWGPGFRFHLGTDVFATFGTPLRSPIDGTVTSGVGSLGGLYVKVFADDGTYFYFAHMSGLVDGFEEGMTVSTGDVVGYVGDSGNAKGGAPHLHIGVYPQGGSAVDPKPILDQFLDDALAQLPAVIEAVREQRAAAPVAQTATLSATVAADPMLETSLVRSFTTRVVTGTVSTEHLYAATANPAAGALSFLAAETAELAEAIDWSARSRADDGSQLAAPGS